MPERNLNAECPEGMTHGLVIVFDSSGEMPAEHEALEAPVWWFASEAEMAVAWDIATTMANAMTDEPAIKMLENMEDYEYVITWDEDEDARIEWREKGRTCRACSAVMHDEPTQYTCPNCGAVDLKLVSVDPADLRGLPEAE